MYLIIGEPEKLRNGLYLIIVQLLGPGLGTGRMCAEYRQRSAYAAAKWAQSHKYGIKLFSIY